MGPCTKDPYYDAILSHLLGQVDDLISPIGFCPGWLRTKLLSNWSDLVEFKPDSLVRQLLVVERIANGTE